MRNKRSHVVSFPLNFPSYSLSFLALILLSCVSPTWANVIWSGDLTPDDPTTWTSGTNAYIGNTGTGTLDITGGTTVECYRSVLGYASGSTGRVTVDGRSSTWDHDYDFYVGYSGDGTLNITNSGTMKVHRMTYVGYKPGSSGTINFSFGIFETGGLVAAAKDLNGMGFINTKGLVSDVDLSFDAGHGLNQAITLNQFFGQNITIYLDATVGWYPMGVGHSGTANMRIADGVVLESSGGYLGYQVGSTGQAVVDGIGSKWDASYGLYIGQYGNGTLEITNGGTVDNRAGFIAYGPESTSTVSIDGIGSSWTSEGEFYVGREGDGTLNITNGGTMNATKGNYSNSKVGTYLGYAANATGQATVDGTGSSWINSGSLYVGHEGNGSLTITNGGLVENASGYLGYAPGTTGQVTVDGNGSTWINHSYLYIGREGDGRLEITNGATVNVNLDTHAAADGSTSSGIIHFDQGTLNTGGLFASLNNLTGTGTINTEGLVSDIDLTFDATHGLSQTFIVQDLPNQNITINLDVSGSDVLGVGYDQTATLQIKDGVVVKSKSGHLGYRSGSTGHASVNGSGSTWKNLYDLTVGGSGDATLAITNGGVVENSSCNIGINTNSTGHVTVDGSGSTWTNRYRLHIGNGGNGTLDVTNGATVTSMGASHIGYQVGSSGQVTVDGNGSTWTHTGSLALGNEGSGSLAITNGGAVTVTEEIHAASELGGVGSIHLDQGTLTTPNLVIGSRYLTGTGTIHTQNLFSDIDLVFDATHSFQQTLTLNDYPGQNITVKLDVTPTSGSRFTMGAGYNDAGSINIADGVAIQSYDGYLGYKPGSTGQGSIDGIGSTWTNTFEFQVGYYGNGSLEITNGGILNNGSGSRSGFGYIGSQPGSMGEVIVDGNGSMWTNSSNLYVINGTLDISHGGIVSNGTNFSGSYGSCFIGSDLDNTTAQVIVDGKDSALNNSSYLYVDSGTLKVTNGGAVNNVKGSIGSYPNSTAQVIIDGNGSKMDQSLPTYCRQRRQRLAIHHQRRTCQP